MKESEAIFKALGAMDKHDFGKTSPEEYEGMVDYHSALMDYAQDLKEAGK